MAKNIGLYTKKLNYAKRETEGVTSKEADVRKLKKKNGSKTR